MPYTKSYAVWKDLPDQTTPISAAKLQNMDDGIAAAYAGGLSGGPGAEVDYVQFTANVSVTATTEGTANTVVTSSAITYDGSTIILVEFFSPRIDKGTTTISLYLYDGASSIGFLAAANSGGSAIRLARRLTPSNAAHTYSIRASVDAGTGTVVGNTGGAATNMPGFIRITRAN